MPLRQTLAPLIDFAFPPRCPGCGEGIMGGMVDAEDALCASCWTKLKMPGQPACKTCQAPLASDQLSDEQLCDHCLIEPPRHDGIAAATVYGPISRELVLALKHSGRIALARPMGRFMALRFASSGVAAPDNALVMPVPLHPTRLWKRGYNQSALLGRALARRKDWQFVADGLRRVRRTRSLDGLGRDERRKELDGAIGLAKGMAARIDGRDIVLVDDVVTSGATTDACVGILKEAGARRVTVACYARVAQQRARSVSKEGD